MNAIEVAHTLRSLGFACRVSNNYHRPQSVTLLRRPWVVRECDGPGFERWFRIETDDGAVLSGAVRTEEGFELVLRPVLGLRSETVERRRARFVWRLHRSGLGLSPRRGRAR